MRNSADVMLAKCFLDAWGNNENAWDYYTSEAIPFKPETLAAAKKEVDEFCKKVEEQYARNCGYAGTCKIITINDPEYPAWLAETSFAPVCLITIGDIDVLGADKNIMTRNITIFMESCKTAFSVAQKLKGQNVSVWWPTYNPEHTFGMPYARVLTTKEHGVLEDGILYGEIYMGKVDLHRFMSELSHICIATEENIEDYNNEFFEAERGFSHLYPHIRLAIPGNAGSHTNTMIKRWGWQLCDCMGDIRQAINDQKKEGFGNEE